MLEAKADQAKEPTLDGFVITIVPVFPTTFSLRFSNVIAVSYTHLTLPTNREV